MASAQASQARADLATATHLLSMQDMAMDARVTEWKAHADRLQAALDEALANGRKDPLPKAHAAVSPQRI